MNSATKTKRGVHVTRRSRATIRSTPDPMNDGKQFTIASGSNV
jgi:hypothetical protein